MDFSLPTTGSWSLAVCILSTILGWTLFRKYKKDDQKEEEKINKRNEYESTVQKWKNCIESGDLVGATHFKKLLDEMRKNNWHLLVALVVSFTVVGCKTKTIVQDVILNDHARIVSPGSVVPDYPTGELKWYLVTPKGLSMLLPVDAPILHKSEATK